MQPYFTLYFILKKFFMFWKMNLKHKGRGRFRRQLPQAPGLSYPN